MQKLLALTITRGESGDQLWRGTCSWVPTCIRCIQTEWVWYNEENRLERSHMHIIFTRSQKVSEISEYWQNGKQHLYLKWEFKDNLNLWTSQDKFNTRTNQISFVYKHQKSTSGWIIAIACIKNILWQTQMNFPV